MNRSWKIRILFVGMFLVGCGGPGALEKPELNPIEAAQQAIAEADTNGDGALDREELSKYPSLLAAIKRYDANKDNSLSADEIEQELQNWVDRGAAIRSLSCFVTLKGKPLQGALVEFVPEAFLGAGIKPATGTTDKQGYAVMSLGQEHLPPDLQSFRGMHLGMYRIQITHPTKKIPAKYNTESVLGETVRPSTREIVLRL